MTEAPAATSHAAPEVPVAPDSLAGDVAAEALATEPSEIAAEVANDAASDASVDPLVAVGVEAEGNATAEASSDADASPTTAMSDAAATPKKSAKAIFFADGSSAGSAIELDVPLAPRRRTGAGLSGIQIEDDLDRHEKLKMMRDGELGSIHSWELVTAVDGPGTRLTVFFNGCPLRCLYCHNPDTFEMRDGEPVTAEELLKKIRRYVPVFKATKGGITLSGGEVLMQPAFAAKILRGAKEMGVHTAIDTSGYLGKSLTDDMLKDVDLVLLDVKSGKPEVYKQLAGRELAPTLEFGRRLAQAGLPGGVDTETPPVIWLRFVVVPGYTDAVDNVEPIADYVAELEKIRPGVIERVEILPFHQMGRDKWKEIGIPYALDDVNPPSKELVERVREQFRSKGLTTY